MRLTRTMRLLGRCLEVLLLVLLLAAVALTLRLAAGPIRLDALTGRLTALIDSAGPFDVTFARPALAWSPEHQTVLLRVEDSEVRTKDGKFVAAAPAVAVRLDVPTLLTHRRVSLRELDVQLPGLQLARQADQRLVLGFGGHLGALPLGEATGGGALERLAGGKEGAKDPRLALLHRVRVTATSLEFVDEPSGRRIESGDADLRLTRAAEGWEMRLEVAAVGGTAGSRLRLVANPTPGSAEQQVRLALDDVPLAAFDGLLPNVPLAGATLPLSATVRLSLDPATMTPGPGSFRLRVPAGTLDLPGLFPEPLDVRGLTLAGSGDAGWHEVRLEEGELGVGDAQAHATGVARRGEAGRSLSLDVTGDSLDAAAVKRLWPLPLVPKTRQWAVEHIDGGTAPTAHVEVSQPPGQEAARPDIRFEFAFLDATSRFLPEWPAAQGLKGTGRLERDRFVLDLDSGHIADVTSSRATLTFTELRSPEPVRLSVDLEATGSAATAAQLLARPPIRLADRLGITPKQVTDGKVQGSVSFALPLKPDLKPDEVTKHATATLTDFAVRQIRKGYDIGNGDVTVRLTDTAVEIAGQVEADKVPATLAWHEHLDGRAERRRIELTATLDRERTTALGAYWPDGVEGTLDVAATVTDVERKPRHYDATGDLASLRVGLPQYGLVKAARESGRAKVQADQPDPDHVTVSDATIAWAGVNLRVGTTISLAPPTGWQSVELRSVETPAASLSGTLTRDGDLVRATVKADRIDLRTYLGRRQPAAASSGTDWTRNVDLDLNAQRVFVGAEPFEAVVLQARQREAQPVAADLAARVPGGNPVSFRLNAEQLPGTFAGDTGDIGALLRALDVRQSRVEGGRGRIGGRVSQAPAGRQWDGEAKLRDLTVRDAPLLARLLTLASFQGLVDAFSGNGLGVERVTVPFVWTSDRLELKQARVVGSGLGARVDGAIDLDAHTLALSGTVAPLYAINRLLGRIPIVGNLMRGENSDAAIAATFSIGGTFADPQISVNPLSALVPGFLRDLLGDLFEGAQRSDEPPARD